MPNTDNDDIGPTQERLARAGKGGSRESGTGKTNRRVYMLDDQLSKSLARNYIDGEECSALKRYATHWLAGGLQGQLSSVDLNRIYAFNPAALSGLAKSERQHYHRTTYWQAKSDIGERPAYVADHIACFDTP